MRHRPSLALKSLSRQRFHFLSYLKKGGFELKKIERFGKELQEKSKKEKRKKLKKKKKK
jgi:hypothetical protein